MSNLAERAMPAREAWRRLGRLVVGINGVPVVRFGLFAERPFAGRCAGKQARSRVGSIRLRLKDKRACARRCAILDPHPNLGGVA